jgi:hypothetical protein
VRLEKKAFAIAGFFILAGCAARHIERNDRLPEDRFFSACQATAPANKDGFDHFACLGVDQKKYEVLIRREPK